MNAMQYVSQLFPPEIGRMLLRAGIAPHVSGFAMLGTGIRLTLEDGGGHKITGDLYPEIAKLFGTTPYGVERNIRTAISKAWSCGALKNFYDEIGMYAERRPSNSACIAQLAYAYASGMLDETTGS